MTLTPSGRIRVKVTGARGASVADIARATGNVDGIPISPDATDQQVLDALASSISGDAQISAAEAAASAADAADSAEQSEGALVGVQAALDGFPSGATLTAPIASRVLLANATRTNGATAYLTEAGREGEFVFSTANLSADVAADPQQGVFVAPASDPTGASGAWVRRYERGTIHASWFGQKADGVEAADGTCTGTDDTAAIQAAIDYAARTSETVQLLPGISVIAAAPKGEGNCQLTFPMGADQRNMLTTRLVGSVSPAAAWSSQRGTMLRSTWNGSGDWQMIGAKTPSRGGPFEPHNHAVWCSVFLRDLTIRLNVNPKGSGIDLRYIPMFRLDNVRVDVPNLAIVDPGLHTARFVNALPTTPTSYGIKGSVNDLPARGMLYNVYVAGYYTGFLVGELFGGNDFTISSCLYAMEVPNLRHGGAIPYILVTNCPNTIKVTANEPSELNIFYLDIEHDTYGGSGPDWVEPFGNDIIDPDHMLRGFAILHMHDANLPWKVNGVDDGLHPNFRIKKGAIAQHGEYPVPDLFPGFTGGDHATATIRRGLVSNGNRYAWQILASNQPDPNQFIGFQIFANDAIPSGQEKRVAGVYAITDGAIDSGSLVFATGLNGRFRPLWSMNSRGDFAPLFRECHFAQAANNGDMWGAVSATNQSTVTKTFGRAFNNPPAVVVTPAADVPADAVIRTASFANRFEIRISKADGSPYPISGSFSYFVAGNPD